MSTLMTIKGLSEKISARYHLPKAEVMSYIERHAGLKAVSFALNCDYFAPQFYASSRYCSHCGQYYNKDLTLDDREWVCPVCGHRHDRDYNAARNLQFYGLWLLNLVVPTNDNAVRYTVSGETPTNACPHGDIQCVTYREGMVYTSPKDMRLQFFETQEQCMAMKQEITNTYRGNHVGHRRPHLVVRIDLRLDLVVHVGKHVLAHIVQLVGFLTDTSTILTKDIVVDFLGVTIVDTVFLEFQHVSLY